MMPAYGAYRAPEGRKVSPSLPIACGRLGGNSWTYVDVCGRPGGWSDTCPKPIRYAVMLSKPALCKATTCAVSAEIPSTVSYVVHFRKFPGCSRPHVGCANRGASPQTTTPTQCGSHAIAGSAHHRSAWPSAGQAPEADFRHVGSAGTGTVHAVKGPGRGRWRT